MSKTEIVVVPASLDEAITVHQSIPEFDGTYVAENINRPDLDILHKNPYITVAKVGDKTAGYMISYDRSDEPDTMHVWLNGTNPQFRGQGVFGALLRNLEQEAKRRRKAHITVMSNSVRFPNMIKALRASGFEVTEQNGDSVRFQKPVTISD